MHSYYEFSYVSEELPEIIAGIASGFPAGLLNLAGYILTALALYTLAQRRGIHNAWLGWIPVANSWLIGSLSDQYRYVVKGEIKSKRKSLLVLSILLYTLIFAVVVCGLVTAVSAAMGSIDGAIGIVIAICCMALALFGISIAYMVVYFMALSDIYHSMDPENSTLFLVLSILFNVTEPFFLFFNRNKDRGMPPRRDQIPPQEPWEQQTYETL